MRIAIIGSGIAGLTAGWLLGHDHEVTLFEAADRLGGHTHTVRMRLAEREFALDTGFLVYNERTYPQFTRLLAALDVPTQPSEMSFSVKCEQTGLEYAGTSLNTLFAQRRNLLRPSFYRMLADILRFNRCAPSLLDATDDGLTLGDYIQREGYGNAFVEHYLIPMGAAIWSAPPQQMRRFPARYFIRFFHNHGLLSIRDRPQWRVLRGGSDRYIEPLVRDFKDRIRLRSSVQTVNRERDHVRISTTADGDERFDHVIIAAHADQALAMLADPTPDERAVLGSFRYQPNEAVLHTDESVLPRRRLAWASWNYHLAAGTGSVALTYLLNRLQSIDAPQQFCVTLNRPDTIRPERVLKRLRYDHPIYTTAAVAAQTRHSEISSLRRTHYCGAYWGYGFHEDGVASALAVGRHFGITWPPCKVASTKDASGIAVLAR